MLSLIKYNIKAPPLVLKVTDSTMQG